MRRICSFFSFRRCALRRRTGRLDLERALRHHRRRAAPRHRKRRRGRSAASAFVAVGTGAEIDARFQARQRLDRPDAILAPGPHQHPHPRRHVAVPRHRRRPEAAGLARKVHLPRRSQERHAGFRALGHAPGLPRNAARRHHHLHRHVLLRGRGGRGGQGGRHARRAGRDHHRFPGRPTPRRPPTRCAFTERYLARFPQRPADRARRGAARALHQFRRDAARPRARSPTATARRC